MTKAIGILAGLLLAGLVLFVLRAERAAPAAVSGTAGSSTDEGLRSAALAASEAPERSLPARVVQPAAASVEDGVPAPAPGGDAQLLEAGTLGGTAQAGDGAHL